MSDSVTPLFGGAPRAPTALADALAPGAAVDVAPTPLLAVDPRTVERAERVRALEHERERAMHAAAEARAAVERSAAAYADGVERLAAALRRTEQTVACDAAELAILVARELVGCAFEVDRDRLVAAISRVLNGATQAVSLRVAPADAEHLKQAHPEVASRALALVADDTLGPGDFVLELPDRIVDGTVDERLRGAREALHSALEGADDDS